MTEVLMWHSKKPRRSQLRGFSIPFWVGGLIPRLATSYIYISKLTPQKWGVIFVLQMCKNLLIRLAVKRSKGSILYNISK